MNTLVYMTTRIIEAYECICDKCDYKWSSINLPATCANKTCRTPRWNRELAAEKKSASPIEVNITNDNLPEVISTEPLSHHDSVRKKLDPSYEPAKRETIEELKAMIAATPPNKSVLPVYTPPPISPDQPDYYDTEKTLNYD
jgi:hypothetical protein